MRTESKLRQTAGLCEDEELAVLMPADMVAALKVALFQRRSQGDDGAALSDLVRQAVAEWLDREISSESDSSIQI